VRGHEQVAPDEDGELAGEDPAGLAVDPRDRRRQRVEVAADLELGRVPAVDRLLDRPLVERERGREAPRGATGR
jgi:hypothetical protein